MADRIIYVDHILKGWIAYYIETAQDNFDEAATYQHHIRDKKNELIVWAYASNEHKWESLPKFGVVALVLFIEDAQGRVHKEIHNGASVYCPYNEPADDQDATPNMKWGVMLENYDELHKIVRDIRLDDRMIVKMLD